MARGLTIGWRRGRVIAKVVGSIAALLLALVACSGDDDQSTGAGTSAGGTNGAGADQLSGTIQVFAAASLTDAFEEIAAGFEDEHPGVEVTFSFAGSSSLVQQLVDGAPADVLATADQRTMDELVDQAGSSLDGEPEIFARNRLALVVPAGNPGDVADLSDLADDDLLVGLCAEEVPCGNLAAETLAAEDISPAVDSYEPDVRSLLTKLVAGELDAGLVYQTDAQAAGDDVEVVAAPALDGRSTAYPVVALDAGDNAAGGAAFVDYVLGEQGQDILAHHGFAAP